METEAESAPKPTASLESVREMGQTAAKLEAQITAHERELKEMKTKRYALLNKDMPSVMDEMQVPRITISGYELSCINYYKANIASEDPPEKREQAFDWVEAAGGGDIISNVVTVAFPKEEAEEAVLFAQEIQQRFHNKQGIQIKRERAVPWNRLTSWLKEYVETPPKKDEKKLPVPLDLLNATIGRIVKIKEVKD